MAGTLSGTINGVIQGFAAGSVGSGTLYASQRLPREFPASRSPVQAPWRALSLE